MTEKPEPIRATARTDIELLKEIEPKQEVAPPALKILRRVSELPSRECCLKENELPNSTDSKTDSVEPSRVEP